MMDVLRPGHAHRSSSDRLLSNYLLVAFIRRNMGMAGVAVRSRRQCAGGSISYGGGIRGDSGQDDWREGRKRWETSLGPLFRS